MANMRKYYQKLFNLFNIANNNINSTFKLKTKIYWRLESISVMEKLNPGTISSFLKDTHIVCSYSRGYRNVREKRWGKQSYMYLATSREDIRRFPPFPPPELVFKSTWRNYSTASAEEFYFSFYSELWRAGK